MTAWLIVGAVVLAAGFIAWIVFRAESTGADLQAAKTTETVNADVAKAIAAGRASSAEPDSQLRAPDSDSRD